MSCFEKRLSKARDMRKNSTGTLLRTVCQLRLARILLNVYEWYRTATGCAIWVASCSEKISIGKGGID